MSAVLVLVEHGGEEGLLVRWRARSRSARYGEMNTVTVMHPECIKSIESCHHSAIKFDDCDESTSRTYLFYPTDVIIPRLFIQPEIHVQPEPHMVAVQTVGELAEVDEELLELAGGRRLLVR